MIVLFITLSVIGTGHGDGFYLNTRVVFNYRVDLAQRGSTGVPSWMSSVAC